jgi:hypothetical protein
MKRRGRRGVVEARHAVLARAAEVPNSGPTTSDDLRKAVRSALVGRIDALRSSSR